MTSITATPLQTLSGLDAGPSAASRPPKVFGAMPTSEQLSHLVQAVAASGDRAAFVSLFQHFAPRVKSYLMRLGSSDSAADELVQETMVLVWRKAAQFDSERAAVSTWIFTIARNVRVDAHRRRGGLVMDAEPNDGHDMADEAAPLDEQLLAVQRQRVLALALAKLSPEQSTILRLSFFEEHPHTRIAEELHIPLGTVKSRIRLAMIHLRKLLDHMDKP